VSKPIIPDGLTPALHHPDYYQTDGGLNAWTVIKEFDLDYWRGSMVAYLLRMGRKPGESELDDMRKVYTFAAERVKQLEEEVRRVIGSDLPTNSNHGAPY
jgi:hypothetical protein